MKKLFLLFILISAAGFSQNKFIEVEVRDTIALIPESFEYILEVHNNSPVVIDEDENYNYDPIAEREKYKANSIILEQLLKSQKYNYSSLEDSNYSIGGFSYLSNNGLIVYLKTRNDILKLKDLVSSLNFVSGSVGKVFYANEFTAEDTLIKKLIAKAKQKANLIASSSGLKLGAVIEVREVKEMDNFMYNLHDTYAVVGSGQSLSMRGDTLTGSLSKALVIKFAAQ